MNENEDSELLRQLNMIEGLNLEADKASSVQNQSPVAQPVETAETLLGEVPFGSVTTQNVGVPFTPENPTNTGVITNTISQVTPQSLEGNNISANQNIMQVNQQQVNDFAAAQVVQTTTTAVPQQTNQQPVVADINATPVFVNLGESTYETKTDFLKLKEGEATRVTLINYNAVGVHEHFKEGLGFFKCKSTYEPGQRWPAVRAICCQQPNKNDPSKLENAGFKVLLPVIEYPVNHSDGKTLLPNEMPKLKVIKLSQQEYNQLEEIRNEYGTDTASFDIYLTRKKESTGFLKYYLTAGKSWRAQFAQSIQEESAKLSNETYNTAVTESAKDISVEKLQQFFNEQRQQEQMAAQFANQPMIDPRSLGIM